MLFYELQHVEFSRGKKMSKVSVWIILEYHKLIYYIRNTY
ncbi:hypothetical protein BACI71_40582 [Bacillus mycoides]|uniref:Uncharacterized protein n=1 Tax=Bacillus mycoides TaxID=1405 RepID=A0A654AB45_BACMY|nr:hypothetical protein BACI71_40582 [Bacillus mycoides]